mmetsp:Transcript_89250/g.232664  ORF Transcript_89250/g.232664 Transcript_89250/m.232664 type:complete len:464 (-) Transcript_89250:386-1777(-)
MKKRRVQTRPVFGMMTDQRRTCVPNASPDYCPGGRSNGASDNRTPSNAAGEGVASICDGHFPCAALARGTRWHGQSYTDRAGFRASRAWLPAQEDDAHGAQHRGEVGEQLPLPADVAHALEQQRGGHRAEAAHAEDDAAARGGDQGRVALHGQLPEYDEAHGRHPVEAEEAELVHHLEERRSCRERSCVAEAADGAGSRRNGEQQHRLARRCLGERRGHRDADEVGRAAEDDLPAWCETVSLCHHLRLSVHAAVVEDVEHEPDVGQDARRQQVARPEHDAQGSGELRLVRLRLRGLRHLQLDAPGWLAVQPPEALEDPEGLCAVAPAGEPHGRLRQERGRGQAQNPSRDAGDNHQPLPVQLYQVGVPAGGEERRVRVAHVEDPLGRSPHGDAPLLGRDLAQQRRHGHVAEGNREAQTEPRKEEPAVAGARRGEASDDDGGDAADHDGEATANPVSVPAAGQRA